MFLNLILQEILAKRKIINHLHANGYFSVAQPTIGFQFLKNFSEVKLEFYKVMLIFVRILLYITNY